MLPTLTVDLRATCRVESDPFTLARRVLGHTHAFDWSALEAAAGERGTHIDALLAGGLLAGLLPSPPDAPFVVFWTAQQGRVVLTICDAAAELGGTDWLGDLPGWLGGGRDFLPPGAAPWALWDGRALTRLHRPIDDDPFLEGLDELDDPEGGGDPEEAAGGGERRYVVDVGSFSGPLVAEADEATWAAMRADPGAQPDYGALPPDGVETLTLDGRPATLHHAWLRLAGQA